MNPFELPQAEQHGPAQPTDKWLPRWARLHPIDGPMMALIGASMAALGRYVESAPMFGGGATLVAVGVVSSVRVWRRRKG